MEDVALNNLSSDLHSIDEEFVASIMNLYCVDNFRDIQSVIRKVTLQGSRDLTKRERSAISRALHHSAALRAERLRACDSIFAEHEGYELREMTNFLLVTAYSDDYSVGRLTEQVNRAYASKHQYLFHSVQLPSEDMLSAIAPKKHCAWYKIYLLKKLLANRQFLYDNRVGYLMWIDADAIIVDHARPLHTVVAQAAERDLIIAEDMNVGCLLNSGVFLVRTTQWAVDFVDDVWRCSQYDTVPFYEQSSIIRCLRHRSEWIHHLLPFHSFVAGGPPDPKLFAHVAVLPIRALNSNRGVTCRDVEYFRAMSEAPGDGHPDSQYYLTCRYYFVHGNYCSICNRGTDFRPDAAIRSSTSASSEEITSIFAYHPAGMANKELLIQTAIWRYGHGNRGP